DRTGAATRHRHAPRDETVTRRPNRRGNPREFCIRGGGANFVPPNPLPYMGEQSERKRATVFKAIQAAAEPQGEIVSRAQLMDIGLRSRTVLRWAEDHVLHRQFRGTYSLHRTVSTTGDRWAAHLSVGAGSVVARDSAVDVLDLVSTPRYPVHLVVPRRPPRQQSRLVIHESVHLHDDDVLEIDGLPCTSVARTLADVADPSDPHRLDRLLDRAVHLRLFDAAALDAVLGRRKPTPGTRALEAAILRLDDTSGRNRTELERILIALIRDSRLPPVINNAQIGGFEVDVWFPLTRAIVEADGDRFHSSPAQLAADAAKRAALEAYGFRIMRVDWAAANYRPEDTIDRIEAFRLANLAPPVPGPPVDPILSTRRNGR
ncbi:MAG: DUF559 domain-containing protein, partial [Patulibacter sp.]|nr:DUF559 domain-containing protein [Patulibacter sp.]